MSLARLRRQQGRQQEGAALLAPVYGWFTEGFDTADLKDAKARTGRRSFRVLEPFVRRASTIAAWRILRWYDLALARHVAPDGVASADATFEPFLLHALLFCGNEI